MYLLCDKLMLKRITGRSPEVRVCVLMLFSIGDSKACGLCANAVECCPRCLPGMNIDGFLGGFAFSWCSCVGLQKATHPADH